MDRKIEGKTLVVEVKTSSSASMKVRRGPVAWTYIYTVLGFALTLETGVMGLITPIEWPCNFAILFVIAALTIYLFLECAWFQNKLLGWKARYEDKHR